MMTSTTYQVTGMTCEHCARAVTVEIESLEGVSAVAVELVPGGTSAVTVTSESSLATEAIAAALDETGAYRLAGSGDAADMATVGSVIAGSAIAGSAIAGSAIAGSATVNRPP
jgi:copper chaperone